MIASSSLVSTVERGALGPIGASAAEVLRFHDEKLLAVDLDLGAGPLSKTRLTSRRLAVTAERSRRGAIGCPLAFRMGWCCEAAAGPPRRSHDPLG
jgi:hypothetical protein